MDSLTFLRDMDRAYRWLFRRQNPFPMARPCHVILVDGTTIKGVLLREDRRGVELANAQIAAPHGQAFSSVVEGRILVLAARINYLQVHD